MSFLGPAFLLGLLGISLPVLIHLLKRRRLQVVPWAAHRFLQATLRKHKRRVQMEDIILLILRCLVVALLALAFARPVFEKSAAASGDTAGQLVLLVDHSASMAWSDGVSSRLRLAADQAARELASAAPGTAVGLVAFSDRVQPVVARPVPDLAVVRRELDRLQTVGRGSDLVPALRSTLDLLDSLPPAPRRVVVIGDQQAVAWRDREGVEKLLARARESKIDLVFRSVAAEGAVNLAVTRLVADSDQVLAGQPVRLQAEIFNGGAQPAANIRVTLHDDGERPVSERLVASLAPGARAQVEFAYSPSAAGFQPLSVRVPPDPLADDDARSIVVRVSSGTRVLLVRGPSAERLDQAFFLARAVVPVPLVRRDAFPVKLRQTEPAALSPSALAEADVVLLAGVNSLSTPAAEALARFVRGGGGLWVFPPADPDYALYNDSGVFSALLPGVVGAPVETPARPAEPPYAHALVDLWNAPANGSLSGVTVARRFALAPKPAADDAGEVQTVLRLGDGSPLLLSRSVGRGRVLQIAAPVESEWTTLPLQPLFVPLVQRGLTWLSGESAPAALAAGDTFVQAVDPALLGAPFRARLPGEKGDPLPAGVVELIDGRPSLRYSASLPGLYVLYPETGDKPLAAFAVNLDPAESDLSPVDPALLAGDSASSAGAASSGSSLPPLLARDLWMVLAFAVLALAAAELVLAQRFSRAK